MIDKQPTTPEKKQNGLGSQRPSGPVFTFWWVVLMALLIWNAALFLTPSKHEALVPYTTFLEQVRAGNVSEVLIAGPQISGTLVKPILWPESLAAGAPLRPGNAETPANPGSENLSINAIRSARSR